MAENIEMIRPINLPEAQQLSENDVFILDSETGGVRKIPKNKVYTPVDDTLSESGEAADAKVTGEKIDELKGETALIQNPVGNKSGELVSFSDGADMPAISVIAHIEPVQEGEGDPSPTNERPISGWESANLYKRGKNLFDADVLLQATTWTKDGSVYSGYSYYLHPLFLNGLPNLKFKENTQYTLSFNYGQDGTGTGLALNLRYVDGTRRAFYLNETSVGTYTHTTEAGRTIDTIGLSYGANILITLADIQIEEGTTATAYEPYTGTTTSVSLGRTVYGGTLDVVSGVLTAYPFYPSYNGETLNGRWLCDRAVYAEGTTPPTGSQVALISGTGTTYTLTPTEVSTLLGENNVWADSGDVDVTYRKDINIVIDELTNAIISLGGNV